MDKAELLKDITECKELGEKCLKEISELERLVTLAECGLKERPLDRDFLEMQRRDIKYRKEKYAHGNDLLNKMIHALNSGE